MSGYILYRKACNVSTHRVVSQRKIKHRLSFYILVTGLLFLAGCKKEKTGPADCGQLRNGIALNDHETVKAVITKFIQQLPLPIYTQENLGKLVDDINRQCGTAATVICFDCIDTYPSQSEIRISYAGVGGPVAMTIDISYTLPGNKMVFHNMHN